jgi:1,4-alpha-glucan branching enzyme
MSRLSKYINLNRSFAFENVHPNIENHTDYNSHIMSLLRVDRVTGKRAYVLINYSPNEYRGYQFGVDEPESLNLKLDSDSSEFGGSNQLENATPNGVLPVSQNGMHGKSHSISIPYVGPYSMMVLEK